MEERERWMEAEVEEPSLTLSRVGTGVDSEREEAATMVQTWGLPQLSSLSFLI